MIIYSNKVKIAAPLSLADVCARIGKAMDPDVGGERSFYRVYPEGHSEETPQPPLRLETQFYATQGFAESLTALLTNPVALHQVCLSDYAARWSSLTPPTLAECQQFCSQTTLEIDHAATLAD